MVVDFNNHEKTGRYKPEDFEMEALPIIKMNIEDEDIKEKTIHAIAQTAAYILNKSEVTQEFFINPDFAAGISMTHDIPTDIDAFYSEDGTYYIHIESWDADDGSRGFGVSLTHEENGKLMEFTPDGWVEFVRPDAAEALPLPESMKNATEDEKEVYGVFRRIYPQRTDEEWEKFRKENSGIISLLEKSGRYIGFDIYGEQLILVPANPFHVGVALGYENGKYTVLQYMDAYNVYDDDDYDDDDYDDDFFDMDKRIMFVKKVGETDSRHEAARFMDYHMDRDTSDGMVLTIPFSKDLVLHCDTRVFENPNVVWGMLHGRHKKDYTKENVRDIIRFLKENEDYFLAGADMAEMSGML